MTEDTSPENLRKFLESDDPAMVRMGISMAKGSGLSEENIGSVMLYHMFHNNSELRQAAGSLLIDQGPDDLKKIVKKNWIEEYSTGKGLGKNNLSKLVSTVGSLIENEERMNLHLIKLLLSYISGKDSKKTNQLIAQILNNIGLSVFGDDLDNYYSGMFIGTLGSNLENLMKLDEEERQILISKDLGGKIEYYELIITCMNHYCKFPYFYGETDFYKPKNVRRNDYIHEHGFGEWEGTYCEGCLGNDLSGGVFGKIARLSKGKKRPPKIPANLKMSRTSEGKKMLKNSKFPIATKEKSGKTKCKYSGKIIPKNNLRIELDDEDCYILPEYIKEQYTELEHSVKPIFNDEGECVEVGEHTKDDKEILFKILLATMKLGRPSTKIEIEKAVKLSFPIDSHMTMLLENASLQRVNTSEKLPYFFSFMKEWKMYINETWCLASQILDANNGNLPEDKFTELKKIIRL